MNSDVSLSYAPTQKAQIVALEGQWAWVEAMPQSACGGCAAHQTCGTGAMASLMTRQKKLRFKIPNDFNGMPQEWIVIEWQGGSFLGTVAKTYLLPAALSILFACVGSLQSEGVSALGALAGMGIGLGVSAFGQSEEKQFEIKFKQRIKDMADE